MSHQKVEFRVFFEIFFEIFKKFQILFFQYIKLQLEVNNVSIIFDNCAIKCQNSAKTRLLDAVIYSRTLFSHFWCHNTYCYVLQTSWNYRRKSPKFRKWKKTIKIWGIVFWDTLYYLGLGDMMGACAKNSPSVLKVLSIFMSSV